MHILLDASNLGATGPEVVIRSVVPLLGKSAPQDVFTLLLPSHKKNENWNLSENIQVKYVRRMRAREISRMWDINAGLFRICKKCNAVVYLTLGDIGPVTLPVPHIIYLHQAYLVYSEPELNAILPLFERLKLHYQRWHFSRSVKRAHAIIVQTQVMATRLVKFYNVPKQKVHVIPPSLPPHLDALQGRNGLGGLPGMTFTPKLRLLFLATYYAHKNHAILPSLIKELRNRNLENNIHFFLTLDGDRRNAEKSLLRQLEPENDMVTNLGRLNPEEVGAALNSADALFSPTLVETFGLVYLETLASGKPVLTSDRDFARYICGDLALYFDPLNAVSIADAIEQFISEAPALQARVCSGMKQQINSVSWDEARNAESIIKIIKSAVTV